MQVFAHAFSTSAQALTCCWRVWKTGLLIPVVANQLISSKFPECGCSVAIRWLWDYWPEVEKKPILFSLLKWACRTPTALALHCFILLWIALQGDMNRLLCAGEQGSQEAQISGYKIPTHFYYIYTYCIAVPCHHIITNYLGDNLYCAIVYDAINSWCYWLNGKAKLLKYMLFPAHLHTCQNLLVLFGIYEEGVKLCWGLQASSEV